MPLLNVLSQTLLCFYSLQKHSIFHQSSLNPLCIEEHCELLYAVKSTRAQYVVRTAFTFPMVVPSVVIILLWKWILNGDTGVLNAFLKGI